jgi:hypothetical protein
MKLKASIRRKINKAISGLGSWFNGIPLDEIRAILKQHCLVLIQEDYTEWAGMLMGNNSHCNIYIGDEGMAHVKHGQEPMYPRYDNMLFLSWYKAEDKNDKQWDVVSYVS